MLQRTWFAFVLAAGLGLVHSEASWAKIGYVGKSGCSNCHKIATLSWEMTPHAKAFESLKPGVKKQEKIKGQLDPNKDYTKDKDCLKCHTTGYGEAGGFKDESSTPEMAGVGCESCHGPGNEYRALHDRKKAGFTKEEAKAAGEIYASDDPAVCNSCHLGKGSTFTEKVDKKYKLDPQKAINERKSLHKKESSTAQGGFKPKLF